MESLNASRRKGDVLPPPIDLRRIGVMDDDPKTISAVKSVVEGLGGRVFEAGGQAEALQLAREHHVRTFILDIHMGSGRGQEGLDVLEQLKDTDDEIYVSILSNHPRQRFIDMAMKLNADFFLAKTPNRVEDVCQILKAFLDKGLHRFDQARGTLVGRTQHGSGMKSFAAEDDPNYAQFLEHMTDQRWFESNKGKFVAIVDGQIVGVNADRERLVEEVRRTWPNRDRFIERVWPSEEVIEIPSPLFIEN